MGNLELQIVFVFWPRTSLIELLLKVCLYSYASLLLLGLQVNPQILRFRIFKDGICLD
uniref:Uncharacterized protein n=1 Tax=Arundo donax TaxID=35708 RepID=A0A0A9B7A5_ARUDO